MVLLHGFAGTPDAWTDVRIPDSIALALPGHGRPAAASWQASLDLLAAEINPGAVVVGYSLGARVALGLLAADAIHAAVLISVNPGIDDGARAARRADDQRWAALLRREGTRAFLDAWEAQPLFASAARATPERRTRRRAAREALDPEALARSLETTGLAEMPDYRAALAARADRAHLIAGALDARFTAIARAAAAGAEILPEVGHDPTLEAPEALTPVLARALARLS